MWYAIKTEPGQEMEVCRKLKAFVLNMPAGNFRVLYCVQKKRYLGQWHDERMRFLPGYLFFVTDKAWSGGRQKMEENAEKICTDLMSAQRWCTGKSSGYGRMVFPVRCKEEELLMKLTKGKDEVGMSQGIIRDGVLKIQEGALTGLESRVKKIDRHKRKGYITVRLNDEEMTAEIGLEIKEKT